MVFVYLTRRTHARARVRMFTDTMTVMGCEYGCVCASVCQLMFLCTQEALKLGI